MKTFRFSLHPLFIAAVICAFLLYSGIVIPTDRHPYISLIALENVTGAEAVIRMSPTKTSSGKYYRAECSLQSVSTSLGLHETKTKASGNIMVFFPTAIAESLFPGKLYKGAVYLDFGESVKIKGRVSDILGYPAFFAESVETCGYGGIFGKCNRLRAISRLQMRLVLYEWEDAGGLLLALLTGCREYVSPECTAYFRDAGVSYVLAISGMHLSFISGMLSFIICKAFGEKYHLLVLLVTEIFFVYFAGATPALLRALLCSFFSAFCTACCKKMRHSINFLSGTFLLHAAMLPKQVAEISFIMSYSATAGIFALTPRISRRLPRALPRPIASSVALSLGAQSLSLPASVALFGCIVPFSLAAALVIDPIASAYMFAGFFALILSVFSARVMRFSTVGMRVFYRVFYGATGAFARLPLIELGEK